MAFAIMRDDGMYFAGRVKAMEHTGFAWADRENAATWDDEYLAIVEARTILHTALDVDLTKPGAIPKDPDFDVGVVNLDD